MQKKLIALAIAGMAAAPAFAQSNVTVYGVAFITFENSQAEDATAGSSADIPSKQRVTSNSSRLGFRGVENLGNGLDAIFQFETSVALDGVGNLFGGSRDSFVGLSGANWGTIKAGINSSPFRVLGARFDVLGQETAAASNNLLGRVANPTGVGSAVVNPGFTTRMENSVMYVSPNWAGFNFSAIYGANENKTEANSSGTDNNSYGVGLNYGAGPFAIGYAYEMREDRNVGAELVSPDQEAEGHRVGAEWNFGMGRVGAVYDRQTVENKSGLNTGELERDAYGAYLGLNFGAHEVFANYVKSEEVEVSGQEAANTDAQMWTLGYAYNLSKRTKLFAIYTEIDNEAAAAFDYTETTAIGTAVGADPRTFALGVRHTF